MSSRLKKILHVVLAAALLGGSSQIQNSLNRDRAALGLTVASPLQNAPPLLAFTTVALGGFRGLISNYLWIRANDLQNNDKYFEAAQLADWITDLEPRFSQVWVFQAWNMAFNISIKFKDFGDRWHWLENAISLLRDKALLYNPDDILIHRELAWLFQFKMGDYLDDANNYYRREWAQEMTPFFGPQGTNFAALLQPGNTNAILLREKYKMDPVFAENVDKDWGPLDWRLPETHAIYWASEGLEQAQKHSDKVTESDLMMLRRVIYQCEQKSFRHGRMISNPFNGTVELEPNLALMDKANDSYLKMYDEENDPGQKSGILTAHRNFLRDAIKYLYINNRVAQAAKWYKYLSEHYPDKTVLDDDPKSYPRNLTLDDYVVRAITQDAAETSRDATTGAVEGMLLQSYLNLALGEDDRFNGFQLLAKKIYDRYEKKMSNTGTRVALAPMADLNHAVLNHILDSKNGLPYAARAIIRTQLRMPPETNSAAPFQISTNTAAPAVSETNSAATNSASK